MLMPMIGAMDAWVAQVRASGKAKALWAFAGTAGGGGVLEVENHEELDAIMTRFALPPSRRVGELRRLCEEAIERGELEERREADYYLDYLARTVPTP
jgi:muconolactone delta-isomerase